MKSVPVLLLLSASLAKAALIATVATDKGNILVELQHAKTPKTVANFMTLAQGTRARIDSKTGEVIKSPMYIGEKFYRVVNVVSGTDAFKIAQTGSGTGTNIGGPGFTFRDEFDAALTHVPYVLSMANGGPNTNGSQIFFTGNVSHPDLDGVHTVFGLVNDVPSRGVLDAILAAGNNATTISNVTFQRTDAAAIAFNELAQDLPVVTGSVGSLAVVPGVSSTWKFQTPISLGTIFRAFRSPAMVSNSWTELTSAKRQVGIAPVASPISIPQVPLDGAPSTKAFYRLSTATHPGAVAPTSLANRTVTLDVGGGNTLAYIFNAAGNGGTLTYTPAGGSPGSGAFSIISPDTGLPSNPYSTGAHDINFDAFCADFTPREIFVKIGCDVATNLLVGGHYAASYWENPNFLPLVSGPVTITR